MEEILLKGCLKVVKNLVEVLAEDGVGYCHEFSNGITTIPWSDFKSECWGDTGDVYDKGIGIVAIQVYAAGQADAQVSFNYCIADLTPAD